MKKDMTTFEMAQAAYENPGKVFVGNSKEPHSEAEVFLSRSTGRLVCPTVKNPSLLLEPWQADGYIWNEKVEPRKWSGEYEYVDGRTPPIGHDTPFGGRPKGCAHYRVKWEAEEVL